MKKSWRDTLSTHPACALFPAMSPNELRPLGEDILKNGLTSPIVLWRATPGGLLFLLDGCNRLDAIETATGCPVEVVLEAVPHSRTKIWSIKAGEGWIRDDKVIVLDGTVDPYSFVVSANIHRRHLTAERKREIIAELIKTTPEKSDRQIAETVKASPTTVGTVRREVESSTVQSGQLPPKRVGRDGRARSQPAKRSQPKHPKVVEPVEPTVTLELKEQTPGEFVPLRAWADRFRMSPGEAMAHFLREGLASADDIGENSDGEIARIRADNEKLRNDKRQLEIKITGLESEIAELKTRREPASAGRCQICREKKRATQRRLFICDFCAEIHELEPRPEAAPPAAAPLSPGDPGPVPLERSKGGAA
jgi:hypothetical protein